nr:reverse transcriptase domain-containing protein [Tanacetum cinerariifolium]
MASNFNDENDPWEFSLNIDDSDLHLTPVLRSSSSTRVEPSILTPSPFRIVPCPAGIVQLSSSTRVEPSSSTSNPVRIIPGLAGIVQQAKMLKEKVFILDSDGALMLTQEYMQKVVEDGVRMMILRVGAFLCKLQSYKIQGLTRSSSKLSCNQTFNPTSSTNPTLKGRIRRSSKQKVLNSNFEENPLPPEIPMAENQTMAQLLQAPTDGYEDAIVIPEIAANNFELKHSLINLVQNKQFFGHEKEDP